MSKKKKKTASLKKENGLLLDLCSFQKEELEKLRAGKAEPEKLPAGQGELNEMLCDMIGNENLTRRDLQTAAFLKHTRGMDEIGKTYGSANASAARKCIEKLSPYLDVIDKDGEKYFRLKDADEAEGNTLLSMIQDPVITQRDMKLAAFLMEEHSEAEAAFTYGKSGRALAAAALSRLIPYLEIRKDKNGQRWYKLKGEYHEKEIDPPEDLPSLDETLSATKEDYEFA